MVVIVAKACLTPVILWPVAHQAPLSIGFSRWEYWSGSPFPSPGDLPNPRDWTCICCIGSQMLYHWATREAPFPRGCLQTLAQYLRPSSSDMIPEASHELRLHHFYLDFTSVWFVLESIRIPTLLCWGPLMDRNLVVWSRPIRKYSREKEADIPWFMQKANKAPAQDLLCSRRPQAPSRWGESAFSRGS